MTLQSTIPRDISEQKPVWFPMTSSGIIGCACAEQFIVFFMQSAVSPCSVYSFRTAEMPGCVDADSFALAMDFVIDATDADADSSYEVPSCEVMSMAA